MRMRLIPRQQPAEEVEAAPTSSDGGRIITEQPYLALSPPPLPTRKVLMYMPTGETVRSHQALQRRLLEVGWERHHNNPDDPAGLVQFLRRDSGDLISLPADFTRVSPVHMFDIAFKNRKHFRVVGDAGLLEIMTGAAASLEATPTAQPARRWAAGPRRKALVYEPTGETMMSHEALQRRLLELGWERYGESNRPAVVLFRRRGSQDLISLPADFARFNSLHMHDIVDGNRGHFKIVNVNDGPAAK